LQCPILILTGKLAEKDVKKYVNKYSSDEVQVKVLNITLASFITPDLIIKELKNLDLSKYRYIMVPGLMQGDLKNLENKLGVNVYRGPRYSCDIPIIIESQISLSHDTPADKLLFDKDINEYKNIIEDIEKTHKEAYKIGDLKIGREFPPRILAEIVDAPRLSIDKIISKANYYIENGADMIDIGAIVGENNSKKLAQIIEELKSWNENIPISIDSLNPEEIEKCVEAGADLVLSIDAGNIHELKSINKNICYTVIPTNIKEGIFPKNPNKRLTQLINNIKLAEKYGFNKLLADPLLESPIKPGLMNSLIAYSEFSNKFPEFPMLAGLGNVFELIDADSIGINALLASIVIELGISVCLTTEYSIKSRNAVKELAIGLKMGLIAKHKNKPPNGLSINLLKAKSKKDISYEFNKKDMIYVEDFNKNYIKDPKGYFKIWVDHLEKKIFVNYYSNNKLKFTISGKDAESIGKKLISLDTLTKLDHSLYLGRELQKAQICLYLGKSYAQDIEFCEI